MPKKKLRKIKEHSEEIFPFISEGIFLEEKGNLFFIVDPKRAIVYETNETGNLIMTLCDGMHNIRDIIFCLIEEFNVSPLDAESDVFSFISLLDEKGLLQNSKGRAEKPKQ